MGSPSPSEATPRYDLNRTLMEYDLDMSRQGFVGLRFFRVFEAAHQSGKFGVIPIEQLLAEGDTRRAPGAGYSRDDFSPSSQSYATEEHGHESPIDDRLRKLYRLYFDAEAVAAKRARDRVTRNQEKRIVGKLLNTAIFTETAAAGAVWSDYANADPVGDVKARKIAIRSNCGMTPNVVGMDWEAYQHLIECEAIIDRLKYAGYDDPKKVGRQALATLFDVDEVVIANAQRNTANAAPGNSVDLSSIWDRTKVFVGHVATSNDLEEPCVGRTFHWSEDGSQIGGVVESYRDETVRADIVRCRMEADEKEIYPECGSILTAVLA